MRLLRGEPLDRIIRETAVPIPRLEEWRAQALAGMEQALQARETSALAQQKLDEANRRIGELSMENELLPRVDAIGGGAAGVYVNNEVRVASLFRGVAPADFDRDVRRMFFTLRERWGGVPFEIANDGEVAALAASMALGANGVLGLSMGTSLAGGYVTPAGGITGWLNELAFAPVDRDADAPRDEWSGDAGCGVQYFSLQAVARLAGKAGMVFEPEMTEAERLREVHRALAAGDARARAVFENVGVCFGYALAHYAEYYAFDHVLVLGGVMVGEGGAVIVERARAVLDAEFPGLASRLAIHTSDEKGKRHAQAVAAASLPSLVSSAPISFQP